MIGSVIGTYTILDELGRGGMAVVYRARQANLERDVALKMLLPGQTTPELVARFENEARVIASFHHPHIIRLHVYDTYQDQLYYVTDLAAGGSLADLMRRSPLGLAQINQLLRQICDALDYAHQRRVVHRDLKPSNVLLDESNYAIVADFGLAKRIDTKDTTKSGNIFGTTLYMAPEQWQAKPLSPQTDIYALGIMTYELLVGSVPFDADNVYELMTLHISAPLPDISSYYPAIGDGLQAVLEKATAKAPDERYASTRDFIREFVGVQEGQAAHPPITPHQTTRPLAKAKPNNPPTTSQFERVEAERQQQERQAHEELYQRFVAQLGDPAALLEGQVRQLLDHSHEAEDWTALNDLRQQLTALQQLAQDFIALIEERQTQPFFDKNLPARFHALRDNVENARLLLANSQAMLDDTESRWKLSRATYTDIQEQLDALLQAQADWQAQLEERLAELTQADALDDQSSGLVFSLWRMSEALNEQFMGIGESLDQIMGRADSSKLTYDRLTKSAVQRVQALQTFQGHLQALQAEYERRLQAEADLLEQVSQGVQAITTALDAMLQASVPQPLSLHGQVLQRLGQQVQALDEALARKIIFGTTQHQERCYALRQSLESAPNLIHQHYKHLRRLGRQRVRAVLEARNFSGQRNRDWQPFITTLGNIIPDTPLPDLEFCLVPMGGFYMGSKDYPDNDELPIHAQIFERPFWIARHPVTNDQWRVAVAAGIVPEPNAERALEWYNDPGMGRHAVVGVNWFESQALASWLGTRLPTEAEWEYAARGVERWRYPWGVDWLGGQAIVWEDTSSAQPADVSSFPQGASWVGALHMLGNVWEWTSSIYAPYPYVNDDAHEDPSDTRSPRVLRGSSWRSYNVMNLRSAHRGQDRPHKRYSSRGVRLACSY